MGKKLCHRESNGTITVFLSLILLLILSLIFTVIEGARVATAKVYAERALTTAMDSVLADYYGPLWEEYHVFGYHTEGGNAIEQKKQLVAVLDEYMSYTFIPNKNLNGRMFQDRIELYDITAVDLMVSKETDLLDYGGKLFIHEAVEYMKYKKLGDGAKVLLNKLSLLETPEKVTYLMDEKMKVEEKLVGIDLGVLELMELFDGVGTSKNGIELNSSSGIQTNSEFIKKICLKEVTMENVGINQETIFQSQKNYYINPEIYFANIQTQFKEIVLVNSQIGQLSKERQKEVDELAVEQGILVKLEAKEKKTKKDMLKIQQTKNNILDIESSIQSKNLNLNELEDRLEKLEDLIVTTKNEIIHLGYNIKPLINKAIMVINNILYQIEYVAPFIEQYENMLLMEKGDLSEQVYEGLEEGLMELKKYVIADSKSYDFEEMKLILEQNLKILIEAEELLKQAELKLMNKAYNEATLLFDKTESIIAKYQISGLTLDYSTLVIDRSSVKSPVEKVGNLLQGSILSLVLDSDKISDLELTHTELLPSELAAMDQENTDFLSSLSGMFRNAGTGLDNLKLSSLFGNLGNGSELASLLGDGVNKAAEIILYQEYIKDHFGLYEATKKDSRALKPSVLAYEQEYLLSGKESDSENLAAMVSRIVTLRTIFNFVSVLSDQSIREEARIVAASLVGFTGLPILISITQVLILVVWAFAEALLDTCALMLGKEVPIIKNKIHMEFPELFLINRAFLQQKASKLTNRNQVTISYQGYLQVFLLLKNKGDLAYRSMDLIQENIRLRYQEDTFLIEDCLFGYEVDADFNIKSKFTGLAFVQQYIGNQIEGFPFKVKASYSY